MAASGGTVTYTPSVLTKYVAGIAALIAAVVLTYLAHVFPNSIGLTAIIAYIPATSYWAVHDLTDNPTPNGIPTWMTFAAILVSNGLIAAVGQFVLVNGTITLAAGLSFAIVLLQAILHQIAEDQGKSADTNVEAWLTAGLGFGIALLSYASANPGVGLAAIAVTAINLFPLYVHINTDGSSISATPVPPAPTPAPAPS
jgi:hypothetical protein